MGQMAMGQTKGIGMRFGYNFSNLSGDIEGAETLKGFHVGAFTDFKLMKRLYLQPELMFSVQGTGFSIDDDDANTASSDLKLSYLSIPVLLSYHASKKFSFTAGPQIGVLMGAKDGEHNIVDDIESYDIAFSIGAAYKFYKDLRVSARFNRGLVSVSKEEDVSWNHNVFQLSMAFIF